MKSYKKQGLDLFKLNDENKYKETYEEIICNLQKGTFFKINFKYLKKLQKQGHDKIKLNDENEYRETYTEIIYICKRVFFLFFFKLT